MEFEFYKYQGTGNDFIIADNRNKNIALNTLQVNNLCNRRYGIGADGLILMNTHEGYDFAMQYYNSDGRESTMCGNGGRCIVQFANDIGIKKSTYSFMTVDGAHEATFADNGWVNLKMKNVDGITQINGDYILDTGSPHYVKPVNNMHHIDVCKEGKQIRYNERFAKEGINVNFAEQQKGILYVRTYERGVENETYSCGTGVTASALVFAHNYNGFNRVEIKTPGGNLAVEFDKKASDHFENIWLCGPATFVFKGTVRVD